MSIWNKILDWYYDTRDRSIWIRRFNNDCKLAFVSNEMPVLLKASVRSGHSDYSSPFSTHFLGFSRSGLKIASLSGTPYFLTRNEAGALSLVILSNTRMVKELLVLGFDTLWVGDFAYKLQQFSLPNSDSNE